MIQNIKQSDNLQFIVQNTAPEVDSIPKLSIFDIPMVYTNIEDLRATVDKDEFHEKISNAYSDEGYKLLGIADQLFRQMTSNKEIQNIEDFNGIKIRTIQNRNHEAFWKELGATIIPLPVGEVYTNLQKGFIDSEENPYENIVAFKFYELQKYVINTYHLPNLLMLVTSDKFYSSLTETEKSIIEEATITATAYARKMADERFEERKKILIDNGITILELPDETKQAMRLKTIPVYENIQNIVGDDDLINSYFGNNIEI